MWFTETPWPPIFLLSLAVCVCVALWYSQKRAGWLLAAVGLTAACAAVYFVERSIVTEAERVEQSVLGVAAAFQRKDKQATLSFISPQADELHSLATSALEWVDVHDLAIKD